jgi:hypothetical protein
MGVEGAEVFIPSPLLRGGMSLVDTPGIGSVFEGNTASTEAFVPHIDAALAVIGTDPPLSGDELSLIARVASQVPDIVVVLNKADRYSESERTEAVAFAKRLLFNKIRPGGGNPTEEALPVLQVSAKASLSGDANAFDWDRLVSTLQQIEAHSRPALLRSAFARGVARLVDGLKREIGESREALTRPIADSEQHVEVLRRVSTEAAHHGIRLRHLFDAEEEQLFRTFEQHREQFRARIDGAALGRLETAIAGARTDGMRGSRLRRAAMELAAVDAKEAIEPWLVEEARVAEALYRDVGERFRSLANDFLEELTRTGALGNPDALPQALRIEEGFRTRSRFYFSFMMTIGAPVSPGTWLLDSVSPASLHERRVIRAAERYRRRLLDANSAGVTQDLRERVREGRRELEAEVQRVLRQVYETADRALVRARATYATGTAAIAAELERLDETQRQLEELPLTEQQPMN